MHFIYELQSIQIIIVYKMYMHNALCQYENYILRLCNLKSEIIYLSIRYSKTNLKKFVCVFSDS